jgi:uncharacterized protein YkwD
MRSVWFRPATTAIALLCAPVLFAQPVELGDPPVPPPAHWSKSSTAFAATAPSAASDWYDTSNREVVRTAYNSVFAPTNGVSTGYVGNPAAGVAGNTSSVYKAAALTRVNYFRSMAGVPAISSFDTLLNTKAQSGALMLYANQTLSHNPPGSWLQYSADGAAALANSNLCQGTQADPGCVKLYMDDHGLNNIVAGHRRWILYPNTQQMGMGDIPEGTNRLWNVLWVIENSTVWGTRPATRDEFVAWPPRGYMPFQHLYNRWSFHYPGAGFSAATVSVTRSGVNVPVRIDSAASASAGLSAPDNSVVFILDNLSIANQSNPSAPAGDTTYAVTIANVIVNGLPRTFTYDVIVFDPATSGPTPTGPGIPAVISLQPINGAGFSNTFTGTFTQTSNNHYLGYLLFLPTPNVVMYTATGSCLVEYNKYSHGVRLIDNAGTGWLGPVSGVPIAPGAQTLTNNQCSVNVANVVATVNGSSMNLTVPVTFFGSLGPVLGTFLQALDSNGVWTGMTQFGNWVLSGAPQNRLGPAIASVSSTATSGAQATYTLVAFHTAGASSLAMIHLLTSASIVGSPVCQVVYFPAANVLNMINDSGTALVSGTGLTPGQAGTLDNSRCSVNVALASRTQSVNNVALVLPVTYTQSFTGQKNVYVNAFDNVGLLSHWVQGSTMLVQ